MNRFFWIPIFSFLLSLALWFIWLHKNAPLWSLLVSLFLSLVGFIIYAVPDPTDSQDNKDASNWRAWLPIVLAILAIFLPAIEYVINQDLIK